MTHITQTREDTQALGMQLAATLKRGDVVLLTGDMGAGKSEFSRGIARGLGVTCAVPSPSFTILNVYEEGRIPLFHFDWYRIGDESELTDMGLDSCWLTFTDSEDVKNAIGIRTDLDVAAIAAFGYGERTTKRLRLNIRSMSNVDIRAQRHYAEPKRSIYDMVFLNTWGNTRKLDDHIGFFDDMLWEAFHAASQSPSYLNRQAYGFVLHDGEVVLVRRPDEYTTEIDGKLSLGIVLLHFTAAASDWAGELKWKFGADAAKLDLPVGHEVIASCVV